VHHVTHNWQKRRSALNHDWLKNQYLPALAKCLNVMAGEIDDEGFLQSFFFSVLPVWETQQEEITRLLQSFENEMSPRVLLRRRQFAIFQSETKSWLGELVHQLWLSRYPVEQWVLNALSKVVHAQAAYNIIKDFLSQTDDFCNVIQNEDFRKQFIEFRYYCQQTAKAIESFPSKVAVL
jgi:hypothetical protein